MIKIVIAILRDKGWFCFIIARDNLANPSFHSIFFFFFFF